MTQYLNTYRTLLINLSRAPSRLKPGCPDMVYSHVQDNPLTAASSIHISVGGGQGTAPGSSKQSIAAALGPLQGSK